VGHLSLECLLDSLHADRDPRQVAEDLGKRYKSFLDKRDKFGELFSKSVEEFDREVLANPTYGPTLLASMRVLRLSVVAGSWTAFECVASDAWEVALNNGSPSLAQRAVSTVPEEPGEISSRQIPFGLAAKHNFDLRNCLGSVLKQKFDFTGVSGIKKAFKSVFLDTNELFEILDEPLLTELEITRNLIAHRAGVVDDEYNRRTLNQLPTGTVLELDDARAGELCEKAAKGGIAILLFVDDWLKDNC
jgi:hypothetical protein